jgi:hypothetical protein
MKNEVKGTAKSKRLGNSGLHHFYKQQGSVVGIVTGLWAGWFWVQIRAG